MIYSLTFTFYKFYQIVWTYVLNIAVFLPYWFRCLSEIDGRQNSIDSDGLDFI
jgi:hypothetical protein